MSIAIRKGVMGRWVIWLVYADGRRCHIDSCATHADALALVEALRLAPIAEGAPV